MDLDSRGGETPGGHSSTNPSPETADPRELADEQPAPGSDPDSEPSGRGHLAKRSKVQEEDSGARSAAGKEDERDTEWGRAWQGRRPKRKWQQSEDGTLVRRVYKQMTMMGYSYVCTHMIRIIRKCTMPRVASCACITSFC